MMPDSGNAAVPDLLLERYRLDEVSSAERTEIERRLRADGALRDRLAQIERSDAAIRASALPETLAMRIREAARDSAVPVAAPATRLKTDPQGFSRIVAVRRWALPAGIAVAALLVVVAVSSRGWGPRIGSTSGASPMSDSGDDRIKGLRPSLTMFRQTSTGSETLVDGAAARQGDVVRLAYQAAGQSFGVIVSIDGRGSVTMHLPPEGREAARLLPGSRILLDHAYELDDAPRWECFYFVTAQRPFDAQAVVDAARREAEHLTASPPARLPLSPGLEQSTFVLEKEHRP